MLSYNGYGALRRRRILRWASTNWVAAKPAGAYGSARRNLAQVGDADDETALKQRRNYGGASYPPSTGSVAASHEAGLAPWHEHFGMVIVSCDRGDLRPLPTGVMIYGDDEARMDPLPQARRPARGGDR